jgi:hypothetical protein
MFHSQQVHPSNSREIIDEANKIFKTINGSIKESPYI